MQPTKTQLKKKIKRWLIFLMTGLVLSGVTAFPIESELAIAMNNLNLFSPKMQHWLTTIYNAVKTTNVQYPYLSYGTDGWPLPTSLSLLHSSAPCVIRCGIYGCYSLA